MDDLTEQSLTEALCSRETGNLEVSVREQGGAVVSHVPAPAANCHHAAGQTSPEGQASRQHVCQGVTTCSRILGDTES